MGMFSGIESASHENNSNYIDQGVHLLEFTEARFNEGYKGKSFIVKFRYAESSVDALVGAPCVWIKKLDGEPQKVQRSLGEIKKLMSATMEVGEDMITDEKASAWVKSGELIGKIVACEAREIMIGDKKDVPYTVIDFSLADE